MDTYEVIALSIVALAALLVPRCFLGKKGGGCCGSDCLPAGRPKLEKKDEAPKNGSKK
jgi:hypothetical protein